MRFEYQTHITYSCILYILTYTYSLSDTYMYLHSTESYVRRTAKLHKLVDEKKASHINSANTGILESKIIDLYTEKAFQFDRPETKLCANMSYIISL